MAATNQQLLKRSLCVVTILCVIVMIIVAWITIPRIQSSGNIITFNSSECSKSDAVKDQSQGAFKIPSAPIILPVKIDSLVPDKFTVIVPTYKRVVLLKKVLSHLCGLDSLVDCIIVVWNNIEEPIPSELLQFNCLVRLYFKKEATNSLNNRFIHYPEIRTEAILSHDDDLIIPKEELDYQFQIWKGVKHLIVGFMPRGAEKYPNNSRKYEYKTNSDRYSIILTTSAMFHVHYLDIYQTMLTDEFRNFIDKTMNCEDILMNAVVAKYLSDRFGYTVCPCLCIKGKDKIINMERENSGYKGLWYRPEHKPIREQCLDMIDEHFNGLPMGFSSLEA